jgi:hypothetical protein
MMGWDFGYAVTEVPAMMEIRGRDGRATEIPHDAGFFFKFVANIILQTLTSKAIKVLGD